MTNTCEKHQREKVIYDLELHETICERCALFDPAHKGHSFLEVSQLAYHNQSLYKSFIQRLHSLHIQKENSGITCKQIRENVTQKIKSEVALINHTYDEMVKEIQKERQNKIEQIERKIKGLAEESKKSMKTLIQEQYFALVAQQQTFIYLVSQNKNIELCQALSSSNLTSKITKIEKELQIIKLQLKNKLAFASHNSPLLLPLPLSRQKSNKEENLMNDIDNQFMNMFDSLRYSRVSEKSNCKTEISFCSFPTTIDTNQYSLKDSKVSIQSSLYTLKVHSKSDIKNLYIKNNIKQINITQLYLNNRQAMEAIRKCTNNTFVYKLDMSDNQLTYKFITQLKKEKGLSKYLKKIVAKGMRIDTRQLKKEGINIATASNGANTAIIGDVTIEF